MSNIVIIKQKMAHVVAQLKLTCTRNYFQSTVYDAYVNLLRTQTEAMSATLAGVDSLTVLPLIMYQKPTDFTNRLLLINSCF